MIKVICQDNKILYNAYNLTRAFWPEKVITSEVREDQSARILILEEAKLDDNNDELAGISTSTGDDSRILKEPVPTGDKVSDEMSLTRDKSLLLNVPIIAADIRELYEKLRETTGWSLPWGMLTGVRPTKLASKWIEEHLSEYEEEARTQEAFAKWFYEDRFVSREKAELAFQVAMRERAIIAKALHKAPGTGSSYDGTGYSLYIGIPFCPTVCSYCSFSSGTIGSYEGKIDAYIDALCCELEETAGKMKERAVEPTSVYIGGGTPTSLSAEQLDRLLDHADEQFRISQGLKEGRILEYTIEAGRPDSITAEKLEVIKRHNATRISINPQTMQQKTLDLIGRRHSVEQVREAFALARKMGFDNINMDLIMGLEGESNSDVRDTLRQISELNPDSLTVHSLAVKRASAIGIDKKLKERSNEAYKNTGIKTKAANDQGNPQHTVRADNIAEVGAVSAENAEEGDISRMIWDAYEAAAAMGMNPYYLYRQKSIAGNFENIGYAKEGKEGIYNVMIMEEVQSIIACGAGASSKIVTEEAVPNPGRKNQMTHMIRYSNVKNIDEYIRRYRCCKNK